MVCWSLNKQIRMINKPDPFHSDKLSNDIQVDRLYTCGSQVIDV